jgi:hypothetical protein
MDILCRGWYIFHWGESSLTYYSGNHKLYNLFQTSKYTIGLHFLLYRNILKTKVWSNEDPPPVGPRPPSATYPPHVSPHHCVSTHNSTMDHSFCQGSDTAMGQLICIWVAPQRKHTFHCLSLIVTRTQTSSQLTESHWICHCSIGGGNKFI